MENITVRVLAQYINENGRPKGGREFEFKADSDDLLYMQDSVIAESIQSMIDTTMKNYLGTFTYISHELIFNEAIQLTGFEQAYTAIYAAKEKLTKTV